MAVTVAGPGVIGRRRSLRWTAKARSSTRSVVVADGAGVELLGEVAEPAREGPGGVEGVEGVAEVVDGVVVEGDAAGGDVVEELAGVLDGEEVQPVWLRAASTAAGSGSPVARRSCTGGEGLVGCGVGMGAAP